MTVLAIRLENFMAFADTDWLELRPISLLFGRNSSGKSTIIRALRLLRQSLDLPPGKSLNERNDHLRFVTEHGLNQGGFESTIHSNVLVSTHSDVTENEARLLLEKDEKADPKNEVITFHFRCQLLPEQMQELHERVNIMLEYQGDLPILDDSIPEWVDLRLGFARSHQDSNAPQQWLVELVGLQIVCSWPTLAEPMLLFSADRECEPVYESLSFPQLGEVDVLVRWSWSPQWYFHTDVLYGHKVGEGDWGEVQIGRSIGFLPHLEVPDNIHYQQFGALRDDIKFVDNLLAEFKSKITDFLSSILYIGPIRPEPKRSYAFDQTQMEIWRKQGWGAYLDFLQRRLGGTQFVQNVGYWLKELGLGPQVHAISARLGNLGFISSVDIFEVTDGAPVNLQDIGFGASQVLPIIVQCLAAQAGSLVIIEQPELHLHPEVQARLADLFIAISHITETEKGSKHKYSTVPFLIEGSEKLEARLSTVRFLVETHSEHLMLRFRRRIAETTRNILQTDHKNYPHNQRFNLQRQNFNLLFIERKNGASTLERIDIDHRGQLVQPSTKFLAFFDDDFKEVANLTRARNAIISIEDDSEENGKNSS